MKRGRLVGYGLLLSVLTLIAAGLYFRYDIQDWLKLRNYQPSMAVVQLADNTTMQDYSRRVFYANRPVIADSNVFNQYCRDDEHSIVLGCYLPGQRGIYIFDVTDDRLRGIKEVTAAHELLHAVYERLSTKERNKIDELTQSVFDKLESTRIRNTIESYRKQDPTIVPNELHSILGSEVRDLPQELEEHYSKYFKDRRKIVSLSEQYEQAFVERKNAIREYEAQLTELGDELNKLKQKLDADDDELLKMRNRILELRTQNNIEEHNALVTVFRQRVNTYNREVDYFNSLVVKYNDIAQQYSNVKQEAVELYKAIDSRQTAAE